MNRSVKSALLLLTFTLGLGSLSGCSWLGDDESNSEQEAAGLTEQEFFERIERSLDSSNWRMAIENLRLLESQFPFGKYADQAQLELIFALYRTGDYEESIAAAERFIRLHPQHASVDYAFYVKGLSELSQTKGFFDSFLPTDPSLRDPGTARDAFATLTELLNRFPNSRYGADARKRLINLRNVLARSEINVANYYFKRGAYLAAVNRGRFVVENFQTTPAVPDGLAVMAQGYKRLEMAELADNAVRTLAANYPDYPALNSAGEFDYKMALAKDDRVLLDRITFGVFSGERPPAYDTRALYNVTYREADRIDPSDATQTPRSIWNRLSFGLFDKP
jgi:outer membrane protein assembly factor BamD